jgi:hypothetical protein
VLTKEELLGTVKLVGKEIKREAGS